MHPIAAVSIKKMALFLDAGTFIPYRRYLLQIAFGKGQTYSIQRFRSRRSALAEKAQLAGYRGIRPAIIDTKTGQEVSDED